MTIKLVRKENACVLYLEGKLDSLTAPETGKVFDSVKEKYDTVTVDLGGVEYVSSAGLRVLKTLHIDMKRKNGEMLVAGADKTMMEIFELTGLASLFRFV